MRYSIAAASFAGVALASWGPPGGHWGPPGQWSAPSDYHGDWTTEVVSQWTTYCPEATQWTHSGKTFTATEATTMTVTDCPYTVSVPATSWSAPPTSEATYSSAPPPATYSSVPAPTTWTTSVAPPPYSKPAPPPVSSAPAPPPAPYPVGNSTTPVVPPTSAPVASTGSAYPSSPVATGAASQLSAAGGLIAAVFGLVAAL